MQVKSTIAIAGLALVLSACGNMGMQKRDMSSSGEIPTTAAMTGTAPMASPKGTASAEVDTKEKTAAIAAMRAPGG